ncbi:GrpB family protein [Solicola sp. PLA-1-18]|uniref:GrpB family protein n=1 Tax=Solicola sp. PLA-1-18 TaxID=3380532 RepID=UPI003B7C18D1
MPTRADIVTFHDPPPPPGQSPWVDGAAPSTHVEVVDADPAWADWFVELEARVRAALGPRALVVEHVGSTSVPGLAAKPIVDVDLTVADTENEVAYVPPLVAAGFELRVREPWWHGHRLLRSTTPMCHLHVFDFRSPETVKHRVLRDWLRTHPDERELYADAKRRAADAATAAGEDSMQYNARKEQVVREIYHRAFVGTGLLD